MMPGNTTMETVLAVLLCFVIAALLQMLALAAGAGWLGATLIGGAVGLFALAMTWLSGRNPES